MWDRGYGFPDRIVTRLRYDNAGAMTTTSGSIAKQVWAMNSCFDPDVTGGGHQPLYFDQFSTIYDQYAVIKSKVIVRMSQDAAAAVPVVAGIVGDDDGSTSTTFATLMEKSHGTSRILGLGGGGHDQVLFKAKFDCRKHLTIDPFTSESYKTSIGSNPTEAYDVLQWGLSIDGTTTQTWHYIVEIHYTVLFTELKDVSQS